MSRELSIKRSEVGRTAVLSAYADARSNAAKTVSIPTAELHIALVALDLAFVGAATVGEG
eukprot:1179614-Prorocentrum_minimum.AAC.1